MAKYNGKPLGNFKSLTRGEKKRFNELLNTYINNLPDDWCNQVNADFYSVCNDDIFNEKFKAEDSLVTTTNHEIRHLSKSETI